MAFLRLACTFRKLASPFGHPTQVSTQVQLAPTCNYLPVRLTRALGYVRNTHKNSKFGRVRQVPIRELGWEFPGWDLSLFAKFGFLLVFFKYPKIAKNGIRYFFSCVCTHKAETGDQCQPDGPPCSTCIYHN